MTEETEETPEENGSGVYLPAEWNQYNNIYIRAEMIREKIDEILEGDSNRGWTRNKLLELREMLEEEDDE